MRTIVMLFVGLLLLAPPARAEPGAPAAGEDHSLTVTNRSQHTITELRASSARDDDWGDDRLGDNGTIEPGRTFTLHLPGQDCTYDVQAKYDDGRVEERRGLNICRIRQLALDGSGAAAPPGQHADSRATVLNGTSRTITEVYVSPPSANDWGADRLGNDQLPAGQSLAVAFTGGCLQDVRVVYDNKSAEERRGLDLCVHGQLHIAPGWVLATELDGPTQPQAPDGEGGGNGGRGNGGSGGGGAGDHIRYLVPVP